MFKIIIFLFVYCVCQLAGKVSILKARKRMIEKKFIWVVKGLAWVNTKFMNRSKDWPDIEFHFISASPSSDGGRQIRKVFSRHYF
jgi:hypothetical protein